jgi:hypothetical protein
MASRVFLARQVNHTAGNTFRLELPSKQRWLRLDRLQYATPARLLTAGVRLLLHCLLDGRAVAGRPFGVCRFWV